MALQPNWVTRVITIPKADLTLVSGTLYELDVGKLKLDLGVLSASEEGMRYPKIFNHNGEVTVAGITYARTLEIVNGYSIEFEDGAYSVRLVNANNNVFDIQNGILVQNQVQVIPTNSAGLQVVSIGSGLTAEQDAKLSDINTEVSSLPKTIWDYDISNISNISSIGYHIKKKLVTFLQMLSS